MAYASSIDFSDGLALNGNDPSFYLAHLRRFAKDTSLLPQAQEAFFALVAGLEEARSEIERY